MRYIPIGIFSLFLADLVSLIWVGKSLGGFICFVLIILGIFIGFRLIKQSGTGISALLKGQSFSRKSTTEQATGRFLQAIAGVLFIMPGFVSDVIGLVLLFPFISQRLSQLISSSFVVAQAQKGSFYDKPSGPIIEGEIIIPEEDSKLHQLR